MSRQELVSAFLEGRLSRRTLIRRLIAGGVSTGAAISYAQLLDPQRAGASSAIRGVSDHYPLVDMKITSTSLAVVRTNARLNIEVTSSEELQNAFFRVFLKKAGGGVPIGERFIASFLSGAGSRSAVIPIDVAQLGSRTSARFYVHSFSNDAERFPAVATAAKTLH
jgi:hypothetical protein